METKEGRINVFGSGYNKHFTLRVFRFFWSRFNKRSISTLINTCFLAVYALRVWNRLNRFYVWKRWIISLTKRART